MRTQPANKWYAATYRPILKAWQDPEEAAAITRALLEHYLGYTTIHHILNSNLSASDSTQKKLATALEQICHHHPIQYVIGQVSFCNRIFRITEDVFIPRPETEALTHHIIQQKHPARHILDLCTGSGCIAITLAKAYSQATVEAWDINPKALALAQQNSIALGAIIHCHQHDLLRDPLPPDKQCDLIVSNPPYLLEKERRHMPRHITDHEPAEALFAPDNNPLLFYDRIASLAHHHLTPQGMLYVEINPLLHQETAACFQSAGFTQLSTHQDIRGHHRWMAMSKTPPTNPSKRS